METTIMWSISFPSCFDEPVVKILCGIRKQGQDCSYAELGSSSAVLGPSANVFVVSAFPPLDMSAFNASIDKFDWTS
jgi:hypothetical protein